jgi:hypothetical protein
MNMLAQAATDAATEVATQATRSGCPLRGCFSDPDRLALLLSVVITLFVIGLFLRQRKIAQNQIEIAELLKDLINKK